MLRRMRIAQARDVAVIVAAVVVVLAVVAAGAFLAGRQTAPRVRHLTTLRYGAGGEEYAVLLVGDELVSYRAQVGVYARTPVSER